MHHPDHQDPDTVNWMCQRCHTIFHGKELLLLALGPAPEWTEDIRKAINRIDLQRMQHRLLVLLKTRL